jgi:hypothetical protein
MAQSPYLDQNAPEILALERQKKLADLLQARALEQPQGQMVSGRYVAPSIIQQLAPLANAYMGRQAGEDVESKQAKLANLIRGQNVAETKDILETMYGKQGQAVPMTAPSTDADAQPSGFYGDKPSVEMQGAVTPDKMSALLKSLNAQSTGGQSLAPTILAQLNAKPAFHTVAPGASLLQETPTGVKPVFTAPKETEQPPEIKLALALDRTLPRDPNTWTQKDADQAKESVLTYIREKRPLNINTNVNTGEKEYEKVFGNVVANQDAALKTSAENAPSVLESIQRQQELLDKGNVITGFGANQRLDLARLGKQLGFTDKNVVADTQQFYAGRAGSTLDSIKSSGLGAGNGFTNSDRDFLEKAKLGGITYDAESLRRQLKIEENVNKAIVGRYNQRVQEMPIAGKLNLRPIELPPSSSVMTEADEIIKRKKKP